jgi:uncharacterized protein (TIGR02145 family)
MKKESSILNQLVIIMALALICTSGCKKDGPEPSYSSLTDQSGNTYKTVEIGSQTWMAENLKTTKYNDNKDIPNVSVSSAWIKLTTPGFCWYDNDETVNKPLYGALYNWYAANTGKLCPVGWHVPTDADFKTLEMFLGMTQAQADGTSWRGTNQGSQEKGATGWKAGENGSNTSGFSALPGGFRYYADGSFFNAGELSYWWCSDESSPATGNYRRLDGSNTGVYREGTLKAAGKYVRCVKD